MKTDHLYKHKNNIDVAFSPRHIEELDIGIVCVGFWWRVGNNEMPKLLKNDTITIHNDDLDQWELYEE